MEAVSEAFARCRHVLLRAMPGTLDLTSITYRVELGSNHLILSVYQEHASDVGFIRAIEFYQLLLRYNLGYSESDISVSAAAERDAEN